jgi:hypothetical protein
MCSFLWLHDAGLVPANWWKAWVALVPCNLNLQMLSVWNVFLLSEFLTLIDFWGHTRGLCTLLTVMFAYPVQIVNSPMRSKLKELSLSFKVVHWLLLETLTCLKAHRAMARCNHLLMARKKTECTKDQPSSECSIGAKLVVGLVNTWMSTTPYCPMKLLWYIVHHKTDKTNGAVPRK